MNAADKRTQAAIERAQKQISKLNSKRSNYSGRELRDIDDQIDRLNKTITKFKKSMG
jgi:peptidoglycan hydrolase CwlO-like protein